MRALKAFATASQEEVRKCAQTGSAYPKKGHASGKRAYCIIPTGYESLFSFVIA
jgi:hypothetical protein